MDELLKGLNAAQRSAVASPASVLQVLAPPGSGKTKTLTARVAHLINHHGFRPWNIIVCTFTIKAAREMKERIRGLVGDGIERKLILGTFHSVARRFLVSYGHYIGIDRNFGIADSSDTLAIIKRIIKRQKFTTEPSKARSRISGCKAKSISCSEYAAKANQIEKQEFASIYTEYEETLRSSNLLDYDDLLLRCVDLLRKRPECVSNIEAVLIDEFQDTNIVQYDLMTFFAQKHHNITIVGDPDQSIYGFRSAEIKNLKSMKAQYPETVTIVLEENYRSSGSILLSALEVIEQDESRPAKRLLSTHCAGAVPVFRKLPSAAIEGQWITSEIQRVTTLTGQLFNYSDFAVLLRSASLSRHIESELGKAGIPYRMVGGHRFFDRVEVKLILDYLRVVNQPEHNDALVRIINVPSRKIGEVTLRGLLEEAEAEKSSLWSLVLGIAQGSLVAKTALSSVAQKGLEKFVNIILTARRKMLDPEGTGSTLLDLLAHIMKRLRLEEFIKEKYPDDFDNRWANVQELIAQATDLTVALSEGLEIDDDALPVVDGAEQRESSAASDALGRFLANVALSTEAEKSEDEEATPQVVISTIHAAKGLEWPVVFIPAAYDGSIPHSRAEDADEERRLLYVAMTRAQALLYVSCPVKNSNKEQTTLSPFLSSKKMGRFFNLKGPSFRFTVTQDLARILRRPCPTDAVIQRAFRAAERAEDDYWPLDGEERPKEISRDSWSTRYEVPAKRRKFQPPSAATVTTYGSSFTMQSSSNYSISSTTMSAGFVSARTTLSAMAPATGGFVTARSVHVNTLREREANSVPVKIVSERKNEKGEDPISDKSIAKAPVVAVRGKTKSKPSGQRDIASFFGKPG